MKCEKNPTKSFFVMFLTVRIIHMHQNVGKWNAYMTQLQVKRINFDQFFPIYLYYLCTPSKLAKKVKV